MKKIVTLALSIFTSFAACNLMAQCGPGGCGVYGGGGYYNNGYNGGYSNEGHIMNDGHIYQSHYGDGSYNAGFNGGYGDHYNDGGYYGSPSYHSSYGTQYSSPNQPRPFPRSNNWNANSQSYSSNQTQPEWSHPADEHGHIADQYAPHYDDAQYSYAEYGNPSQPQGPNDSSNSVGNPNSSSGSQQSYPGSY